MAGEGTSGDMVYSILKDWKKERDSYVRLCEIYFNIASKIIGEEKVRQARDEILEKHISA